MSYCIRIRYAEAGNSRANEIDSLPDEFAAVARDIEHELQLVEPEFGREPHYVATYRFDSSEDISAILDRIEEDMFAGIKWYVIHSHSCQYGDADRDECTVWGHPIRERGSVPEAHR